MTLTRHVVLGPSKQATRLWRYRRTVLAPRLVRIAPPGVASVPIRSIKLVGLMLDLEVECEMLRKVLQMEWRGRIHSDPDVCHGKPCIAGTRVMVSVVLDNIAAGESYDVIRRGYHVEDEDIKAALLYAAELARDPLLVLPVASGS